MKKVKKLNTKLKIGITLALKSNDESIWSNGMKQNVLFFADMLKRSKMEYDVYILNTNQLDFEKKPSYMQGFNFCFFDDHFMDMDIIFMMGAQIHDSKILKFKSQSKDKKYVGYKCGNNYIISLENMLFKDVSKNYYEYEKTFDECWYVPQQHDTNQGYFTTLYRTNSFPVPFIWHHRYLKESAEGVERSFKAGSYKKNWKYDPNKKQKYDNPVTGWNPFGSANDIFGGFNAAGFDDIFGSTFKQNTSGIRNTNTKGPNLAVMINLTLE
jgi:DnaJ-class molecular chaperone